MSRLSRNGPRLEIFKFSLYLFFPIWMFAHYGDPEWYDMHVKHLVPKFIRPDLKEHAKPLPQNPEELRTALEEARAKRLELREKRRLELEKEAEQRTI